MCVNKSNGTTSLYKISKGKRVSETPVITTFNYEIRSAAMTVSASHSPADKSVVLVAYDAIGDVVRIYTIQVSHLSLSLFIKNLSMNHCIAYLLHNTIETRIFVAYDFPFYFTDSETMKTHTTVC